MRCCSPTSAAPRWPSSACAASSAGPTTPTRARRARPGRRPRRCPSSANSSRCVAAGITGHMHLNERLHMGWLKGAVCLYEIMLVSNLHIPFAGCTCSARLRSWRPFGIPTVRAYPHTGAYLPRAADMNPIAHTRRTRSTCAYNNVGHCAVVFLPLPLQSSTSSVPATRRPTCAW